MLMRMPQPAPPIRVRSAAMLVGLLGAVMGAVNALTGVARGHTSLEAISAGLAEALVTIVVALVVVIPGLWVYRYFRRRGEDPG